MEDEQVLNHIKKLTEREEYLYGKENLSDEDLKELHNTKSQLDQWWDLLRQRRALRDADQNPKRAAIRMVDTIENYKR